MKFKLIVWRGPALSEVEEPALSLSKGALARATRERHEAAYLNQ